MNSKNKDEKKKKLTITLTKFNQKPEKIRFFFFYKEDQKNTKTILNEVMPQKYFRENSQPEATPSIDSN